MRLETSPVTIKLTAENYGDKMFLVYFCKEAKSNNMDNNLDLMYEYSDYRANLKGGGSIDCDKVLSSMYDVEEKEDESNFYIAIEEITCLEITTYQL